MADDTKNAVAATKRKRRRSEPGEAIRRKIKSLATEMFIRHGYNGITFLDLAKELGINHSLIHYHFGTKANLAEEVLQDFAEIGIRENRAIWGNPDASLFSKFVAARDRMYRRFIFFNPAGKMQHPTGLVSRFSMDAETVGPNLRSLVQSTQESLDQTVLDAVRIAVDRGELIPDAPTQHIMLQISSILYVAGPTARYGWEFTRLDEHFHGALAMLMRAYGVSPELPSAWPSVKEPKKRKSNKTEPN
ncbi:TetR/AcrR family transcriptional regulator [Novosphingopyxis sp.]|uniref:TetR/AcrR family transcriptional regulator n=1 Tax=Novosphingopyxis sp. TaxID=2709690 RepID=UPI003B5B6F78